jgi:hypothetical protein
MAGSIGGLFLLVKGYLDWISGLDIWIGYLDWISGLGYLDWDIWIGISGLVTIG